MGNTVFRVKTWEPGIRDDIISFDSSSHSDELKKLNIGSNVLNEAKGIIRTLVIAFWDVLAKDGLRRPMLGYEFCIDTGEHIPFCCRKPSYGPNESKIIMDNIKVLLTWDHVYHCTEGGWGSPVVLAPKPHQEHIFNIDDFIWRMCISYRALIRTTNPFEYPIGRCNSAIEDVGDGSGFIWFISLDAAQGYNQISVRKCDQQKLAFFAPDNKKYTFSVMPFGPTNTPNFIHS